jgi:hypothetical protein
LTRARSPVLGAYSRETDFLDDGSGAPISHAHILFDKTTGEYRLFNDHWYPLGSHDCGIWIVRDGLSQEVHRSSRGIRLEPGDEITSAARWWCSKASKAGGVPESGANLLGLGLISQIPVSDQLADCRRSLTGDFAATKCPIG